MSVWTHVGSLLQGGLGNLAAYLAAHVLLCLLPAFFIAGALTALIEDNRENIHDSIRNIRDITAKINRGQGTVAKLINEDRIYSQTDELVKELRETIEDAREQAPITSFIRAALTAF